MTYALRDDFLSPAEQSFYLVLRSVVGNRLLICPKVALGDLFFAKAGDSPPLSTIRRGHRTRAL
jgi:hypothetical protein